MENIGRRGKDADVILLLLRPSRAVQTKGTPRVIEKDYNPNISEDDQEEQENYRIELQTIYRSTRPKNRDIQNISKLMHQSFELQRKYITEALEKISEKDPDQGKTIEFKLKAKVEIPSLYNTLASFSPQMMKMKFKMELKLVN